MARHRNAHSRRGSKHHPLVVAGAAVLAVGAAALLWEKYKTSSSASSTTVVQGATLPSNAGGSQPTSHGDSTTSETVDQLYGT